MKETMLARKLCEVMDLNGVQAGLMRSWNEGLDGRGKGGCLGDEIQRIAFARGLLRVRPYNLRSRGVILIL